VRKVTRLNAIGKALAMLAVSGLISLAEAESSKSMTSPLLKTIGSSQEWSCVEKAKAKIEQTGRPYPNFGDKNTDVWLGDQLLHIPNGYLLRVNSGTSHFGGPGVSATLETRLPDLAPHKRGEKPRPSADGIPDNVTIYLTCSPNVNIASLKKQASVTKDVALKNLYGKRPDELYSHELPELGLVEYTPRPDLPYFDAFYFPIDDAITDPHGGTLSIWCAQREPEPKRRASCRVRFPLREGIAVMYDFPRQQLAHWRKINQFVVNLLQSSSEEI
jgi:hypothetical protein